MIEEVAVSRSAQDRVATRTREIKPSGIRRFFDLVNQRPDVISLGIGEPDLAPHLAVRQAAAGVTLDAQTQYAPNAGLFPLREAISQYVGQRSGVWYDPAREVLVTAGVAQGIDVTLRAILNPGDQVLIPEPCFVSYAPSVVMAGGHPVPVPLRAAERFKLTPENLEPHITRFARVLMLCFPNNPTGAVMTADEYRSLIPLIERHDLTVISDEIYSELTFSAGHTSPAQLPGMRDRTIVLNGFSKTFAMSGWRLGYAVGPHPIIETMTKVFQHCQMCAPTAAQVAGVHALSLVDDVAREARELYRQRTGLVYQALSAVHVPCVRPEGAFYIFPDIGTITNLTDEQFAHQLLEEEAVAVIPGSAFGSAGGGHIRCSCAVAPEKLEMAVERILRFISRHRQR